MYVILWCYEYVLYKRYVFCNAAWRRSDAYYSYFACLYPRKSVHILWFGLVCIDIRINHFLHLRQLNFNMSRRWCNEVGVAPGVNGLIGTRRPEQHGGVGKVIDSRHDFNEAHLLSGEELQGRAGFATDWAEEWWWLSHDGRLRQRGITCPAAKYGMKWSLSGRRSRSIRVANTKNLPFHSLLCKSRLKITRELHNRDFNLL